MEIFNNVAEDIERDRELGEATVRVENIHFEKKDMGLCLIYERAVAEIAMYDLIQTTEIFAAPNGQSSNKFSYADFVFSMQEILNLGQMKDLRFPDWESVYRFLRENQTDKASLDLAFREKEGKKTAYFDINLKGKRVQKDIKLRHISEVCSILNEDNARSKE